MKTNKQILLVPIIALFVLVSVHAQIDGKTVMENVYNRPTGDTMQADLRMVLINARGATREREIVQYTMNTKEGEKKIMFFMTPADVRSTSFMTWSWDDGRNDDQWIYLPAIKRVKRISSDGKSDSFMGSDFTYDDLGARHPSEDIHRLLGEERVDGVDCYIVESVPVEPNKAYAKTVTRIQKEIWVGLKKEYHDKSGTVIKTLIIDRKENIDGFWVVVDMTMKDHNRGSSTKITMDNVSFSVSLDESFFSERQMGIGPRR